MAGPQKMLKEEQKAVQIESQESLHTHFQSLMSWEVQEGQTLQDARTAQVEKLGRWQEESNLAIQATIQKNVPPVTKVKKAASGSPVQAQRAQKFSVKEKLERRRMAKKAKKELHPQADADTYILYRDLMQDEVGLQNSFNEEKHLQVMKNGFKDNRVIYAFCKGYQKNENGEPKTERDVANMKADSDFIDNYGSCDLQKRKPYLDKMVDYFLNLNLKNEMLELPYLRHHATEMHTMAHRTTCMENIMIDPVNKPYFEAMDSYKREFLNAVLEDCAGKTTAFNSQMGAKGIQCSVGVKMYSPQTNLDSFKNLTAESSEVLETYTKRGFDLKMKAVNKRAQEIIERESKKQIELFQEVKDTIGKKTEVETTTFSTAYTFEDVGGMRDLMEAHPEEYAANKELLDLAFQEAYRSFDAMGDLNLVSNACQEYMSQYNFDHKGERQSPEIHLLMSRLLAIQVDCQNKLAPVVGQINALRNVIKAKTGDTSEYKIEEELEEARLKKILADRKAEGAKA